MKILHSQIEYLREYAQHLKNLNKKDLYTRFGYLTPPEAIDNMILNILYQQEHNHIFTYKADDKIVGFGHLAREGEDWELAVSVEESYQGQGIADELMDYMIKWGKTHGVEVVYMHCISENQKIQHLARKHGLKSWDRTGPELTARVKLPEPTIVDYTNNLVREQSELAADIVKLQRVWLKNWTTGILEHKTNE